MGCTSPYPLRGIRPLPLRHPPQPKDTTLARRRASPRRLDSKRPVRPEGNRRTEREAAAKSEAAAGRRTQAESAAAEALRARVELEGELDARRGGAADAAQGSEQAQALRQAYERKLAELRRPARRRLAVAVGVAALLAIGAWLAPRFQQATGPQVAERVSGMPLQLKLDYGLRTP